MGCRLWWKTLVVVMGSAAGIINIMKWLWWIPVGGATVAGFERYFCFDVDENKWLIHGQYYESAAIAKRTLGTTNLLIPNSVRRSVDRDQGNLRFNDSSQPKLTTWHRVNPIWNWKWETAKPDGAAEPPERRRSTSSDMNESVLYILILHELLIVKHQAKRPKFFSFLGNLLQ